jgi:hypothetical protein
VLGSGASVSATLSEGAHVVTASVTDSDARSGRRRSRSSSRRARRSCDHRAGRQHSVFAGASVTFWARRRRRRQQPLRAAAMGLEPRRAAR